MHIHSKMHLFLQLCFFFQLQCGIMHSLKFFWLSFYLHMNYGSMMASLMNAIMLQASLEKLGVVVRMQSTLMMQEIAEPPYIRCKLFIILEKEEL